MISARGKNGIIGFDGYFIRIERTPSVGTFLNQGVQGERYILLRAVTAVEFRDPIARGGSGFISFDFAGKNPPRGGIFDAMADENAVVFGADQTGQFLALRNAVLTALANQGVAPVAAPPGPGPVPPPNTPDRQPPRGGAATSPPTGLRASSPANPERDSPTVQPSPIDVSKLPVWLRREWRNNNSGWIELVDVASSCGWRASLRAGVMQFVHNRSGRAFTATSIDEALSCFTTFYVDASRAGQPED